ncbi:MAG: flagellin [Planctomycetota bacterium]|nr:flagellin [Planctomycetota bacterium]
MSRINTNISSLQAMHKLLKNNADVATRLERLSSGLKINRGKDAPAALIASETLRSEISGINQAIDNSGRAGNVINTAEGSLSEISQLLLEVQGLTNQAANTGALSNDEIAANQLQVDSILSSINRIASTTQFNGVKLLNGNFDYTTTTPTNASNVRVNAALVPSGGGSVTVAIDVTTSAQTAHVGKVGAAADNITVEVTGNDGSEQLTFATGTTVAQMITAVNAVTTTTGVSASLSGADLRLDGTKFGASQFVSVKVIAGTWATVGGTGGKDTGVDAVVKVNGAAANVNGTDVSFRNSNLDVEFTLASAANVNNGTATFDITGGGATFAIGSKVSEPNKAVIGLASVSSGNLGDAGTGYLSTLGSGGDNSLSSANLVKAQRIIDKAIKQVATLRGRLGAFQKEIIDSNINSLSVALENVTASESAIRDADFASETAALTRAQILVQATTSVLAQANTSPQSVLALLQR